MTRLLLVRHGQSVWNAKGRWQGQADPPLTSLGHEQASVAAKRIGEIDVLASSDLVRALQTATGLKTRAGVDTVEVDARLRERHAGEWQGLTRAEIDARYPGYLEDGRRPPGWESGRDLHERAVAAVIEIADAHPAGEGAIVTHGGVIYSIEAAHGVEHSRISNLGGRWIEIQGAMVSLGDRVDLLAGEIEATVPDQI